MGDLPEFNASSGSEAIDDVIARDKQAEAAAARRARVAAEKRAKIAEAQLAKVESSNISTSDFSSPDLFEQILPHDALSRQNLHVDSSAALPREVQNQRRMEAMQAVKDADEQSASEKNRDIEAVQAEHQKKAAESAEKFGVALSAAAITVGVFAAAIDSIDKAQSHASESINDQRARRGQAMRELGYSPEEVKKRQERAESGVPLPGNMTAQQEIALLEGAAAAKGSMMIPASAVDRRGIDAVLNDNGSVANKGAALANPMMPGVIYSLRTQGRKELEATAGHAISNEAWTAAQDNAAAAGAAGAGQDTRGYDAERERMVTRGGIGGVAASISGIPYVGAPLRGVENWLMKIHDKLRGSTPPSTTTGRNGP